MISSLRSSTKKVYEEIGEELQEAYESLPGSFMGVERIETLHGKDRCGVMVIEDFYKNIAGHTPRNNAGTIPDL